MEHGNMRKIKPEKMEGMKEMASKPMYPHFSIGLMHLPEAKKWEIGKKYKIALELKMNSLSIDKMMGEEHGHAGFDIIGIEPEMTDDEKSLRSKLKDL